MLSLLSRILYCIVDLYCANKWYDTYDTVLFVNSFRRCAAKATNAKFQAVTEDTNATASSHYTESATKNPSPPSAQPQPQDHHDPEYIDMHPPSVLYASIVDQSAPVENQDRGNEYMNQEEMEEHCGVTYSQLADIESDADVDNVANSNVYSNVHIV